jgi:DNA-binding transcriptional LysR family regulator
MQSNTTQLTTIALFCKSAELGSFSSAAQAMGVTPAAVSRGVGRLEDRLGIKLFRRTTRSMQLTDDGRTYFEQCRTAIAQIDAAEKALTGQQTEPRGLLRISAPSTYAHYRLLPRLADFKSLYPLIELDINISNRNIDFVEEGYDVAIRLGTPPDSRLIARKLEDARIGVYASPAYLKKRGKPDTLEQLKDRGRHTLLPFVMPSTGKIFPWMFMHGGELISLLPHSNVKVSDDPLGCAVLAASGMGLVQTYSWIADSYGKELVEVLKPFAGCTRPFYLLYPQNKHLAATVRALVDFLAPPVQ